MLSSPKRSITCFHLKYPNRKFQGLIIVEFGPPICIVCYFVAKTIIVAVIRATSVICSPSCKPQLLYVISKRILPSLSFADKASIASFTLSSLSFFHTLTLISLLAAMSITSCNSLLVPPVEPINFICLV